MLRECVEWIIFLDYTNTWVIFSSIFLVCSSNSAYLLTLACRHNTQHTVLYRIVAHRFVDGAKSVCVNSIAIQCICRHQQPCHTDPLLLSTMLRCVATEIEIMIMCRSDCIKVLPLQKKPGGMKCKWQCGADGLSAVALAPMNLKGGAGYDCVCETGDRVTWYWLWGVFAGLLFMPCTQIDHN